MYNISLTNVASICLSLICFERIYLLRSSEEFVSIKSSYFKQTLFATLPPVV